MRPISIYVHIPFCLSRCAYCDFYSTTDPRCMDPYLAALLRAVSRAPAEGCCARTVYFGGGTPSLFGGRLLTVLDALRARFPLAPDAEVTLEANPATVTPALLERLREGGFNRISFGLQDCGDDRLRVLGRRHTVREGEEAVRMARAAGFSNLSGDMMLATPGQTPEGASALAEYLCGLELPHISAYLLRIEPGTPFARDGMAARCPDDDASAEIYLAACDTLRRAGYRHYEISNFARPGFESRHNLVYWRLEEYLGLGPAAHSMLAGRRFFFPRDLAGFIAAEDPWTLTEPEGDGGGGEEYLMLSLRLAEGLDYAEAERRGLDPRELRGRAAPMAAAGLLTLRGDGFSLTERGWLVSNAVIASLL